MDMDMDMDMDLIDARVLEFTERMIKENPDDEDLKRCYALYHNAMRYKELTPEKQEAVDAELSSFE